MEIKDSKKADYYPPVHVVGEIGKKGQKKSGRKERVFNLGQNWTSQAATMQGTTQVEGH